MDAQSTVDRYYSEAHGDTMEYVAEDGYEEWTITHEDGSATIVGSWPTCGGIEVDVQHLDVDGTDITGIIRRDEAFEAAEAAHDASHLMECIAF